MPNLTYPCFWQKTDESGRWYWIYYAPDGNAVARSSETYVNRSDCTDAVEIVKNAECDPLFYTI